MVTSYNLIVKIIIVFIVSLLAGKDVSDYFKWEKGRGVFENKTCVCDGKQMTTSDVNSLIKKEDGKNGAASYTEK